MSEKPGFVLYGRQKILFDHLTMEERGELITAIFAYFDCREVKKTENRVLSMAFEMIREQMDFDNAAYMEKCRKLSKNASKRHLKKDGSAIDGNCTQSDTDTKTDSNTVTVSKAEAEAADNTNRLVYGAFENVYLSNDEYSELSARFPDTIRKRIDRLSEYIKNTGHHYADHAEVIRRWAKDDHPSRYKSDEDLVIFDEDEYFEAALARSERYLAGKLQEDSINEASE